MKRLLLGWLSIATLLVSVLALPGQVAAAGGVPTDERLRQVEAFVTREMKRAGIPGMAVAIVAGGETVYAKGFGSTAMAGGQPVTEKTLFPIASTTKTMTATAILQLVEQGKVNLDDPVRNYLPWFRTADEQVSGAITVRHLLNHTSGMPENSHALNWKDHSIESSLEAGGRSLQVVRLQSQPGEQFAYNNSGYSLLGLIIEQVSGQSYAAYMQEHIWAPLGMVDTMTKPGADRSRMTHLHLHQFLWLKEVPLWEPEYMVPAGGGPISTVADMARFASAQLDAGEVRLLQPASLAEAHSGGVPKGSSGEAYSLGWVIAQENGSKLVYHTGGTNGGTAWVGLLPEQQLGVVVLSNTLSTSTWMIARGVAGMLAGGAEPVLASDMILITCYIATGMLAAGLLLLVWLAVAVPGARRRRLGAGVRWREVVKTVLVALSTLLLLFFDFAVYPKIQPERPLPFGFYGWDLDQVLGLAVLTVAALGWLTYRVVALAAARSGSRRRRFKSIA